MLQSAPLAQPIRSFSSEKSPNCRSQSPSSKPPFHFLRFRTSYRDNLRYLNSIGIINSDKKIHRNPSPETLLHILSTVNFLKSKGFSESHFARLAYLTPQVFSPQVNPADLQPVFDFLTTELAASEEESRDLILLCPHILQSNVQFCLRPTLLYLRDIGVESLNKPTNLNAHLLNTRVKRLEDTAKFLLDIGFSQEEATKFCGRLPAIFGYSIDNNLLPKFEYLVGEMERSLDELKGFPQYFAFSLEKRIKPRHLHLKRRNVVVKEVPLKKMLMWNDKKFYAKWNW
ncbi:transcription termination factor MTEF1, chloroplastic-like [Coffea arabica]|uniref:Transcription termination factor MTEF1, chloroplastic-like n=1 Tax=Coffea arabica TaxID=13443 RepID=A0A6P6VTD8_COFAR|nr:transcription termination factor MTEF1, chloroplastic-like [Coffea arabica]XP_027112277.1 transcription termination factor MTEF1, chloroplastic-like [Coffea arabica]